MSKKKNVSSPAFDVENQLMEDNEPPANITEDDQTQPNFAKQTVSYEDAFPDRTKEDINGWDTNATRTINNWFDTCRLYRWRYQFILDRNYNFKNKTYFSCHHL